jgi:quercetin dioxygenase-like cupin family protein
LQVARDIAVVWMPGGVRTEIHLGSEDTGGAFCLLVDEPPVGWALPAHRHSNEAETILILEGEFVVEVDGEDSRLCAGETVHVHKGAIHSSANVGASPGRRVVLFSPAGMERFFLEAGLPNPDSEIDLRVALASAVRHGWEFVHGSEAT